MKSFFERAGIFGYSYSIERALLASLIMGTPVLLLGKIGEAKTQCALTIARLLIEDPKGFLKISADKVQFDDLIGFPNPAALAEGRVQFVHSDTTIWDKEFVLVDEISRCNPQLQSKFLELILERQVMGIPTGVRWIWCTMNPLDYPGSQPLDGALAGRMGYVIPVPETADQQSPVIEAIAMSRNRAQRPALDYWLGAQAQLDQPLPPGLGEELRSVLEAAATISGQLDEHWREPVAKYLAAFLNTLKQGGLSLDGRRLVMIRDNIITNIAIQTVQTGRSLNIDEIKQLSKEVILLSVPWLATIVRETFDRTRFIAAHTTASDFLDKGDSLLYHIITERDPLEKLVLFLEHREQIGALEAVNLVSSLYDPVSPLLDEPERWQAEATQFVLKLAMMWLFLQLEHIPAEVVALASKQYPIDFSLSRASDLGSIEVTSYAQAQQIVKTYETLRQSSNPQDWAAAYWTFFAREKAFFTADQILRRLQCIQQALGTVVTRLRPFIPQQVPHVSTSSLDDLLEETEDQQASALSLTAAGAPGESSRAAFSL